jgi:tetratricopeptide (TPR) repeat protein
MHAAEQSVKAVSSGLNKGGLAALARAELASHRFAEARSTALELKKIEPDRSTAAQLLGDAALELGDYTEAEAAYAEMLRIDGEPSVSSESRSARVDVIHGRLTEAREHLQHALAAARTASEPSPDMISWCHVQLGELAFKQGDFDAAETEYAKACEALPEYYPAEEHLAELRGAQGRYAESAAAYQKLIERVPRPELLQALGDLYVYAGKPEEAKPWQDRAAAAYEASMQQGSLQYYHHGAGFYSDSVKDPVKALECAKRDFEIRHSIFAWDAIAWAYLQTGQVKEAADAIAKALATGVKDPHILYHASMIRMSQGDLAGGKLALEATVAVNPRYHTFHVHR